MNMLLDVTNLTVHFHTHRGVVHAVENLSLHIQPGEALGLVGESGSGKSVSMLALRGLLPSPPARIERGIAHFEGQDLLRMPSGTLRRIRGRRIAMVFQDPMTSLNPYMTIGHQVIEPLVIHEKLSQREAWKRCAEALAQVGIPDPDKQLRAYPHQFSGGMRQRVMIAMALVMKPALLIADEPTTALDVTVQAQVLELIRNLQQSTGMAVILVSHNLGVVADLCQRVVVMYAGRVMEQAPAHALFHQTRHPYTKALMRCMPGLASVRGPLPTIHGFPPDLSNPGSGCPFTPRCPDAVPDCASRLPEPIMLEDGHLAACIRTQDRL